MNLKMNKERLLFGADILDRVEPESFDLECWELVPREEYCPPCGFVACAVGHMTHNPQMQAWGLRLQKTKTYEDNDTLVPVFGKYTQWTAVDLFFGLQVEEAEYLFMSSCYDELTDPITPAIVAARIREFVATDGGSFDDWQITTARDVN